MNSSPSPDDAGSGAPADVLDVLVQDLRSVVVRRGLPIRPPAASRPIFELACVRAHATGDDLVERAASLDGVLRRILVHSFGDSPDGHAAQVLFAFSKGTKGTTLTVRRERCAELRGVHPDHWRKHLEPDLLRAVAAELHLLDRHYRPRLHETFGQVPDTAPEPPADDAEAFERHELDSRIAAHLYGMRAEVTATYRALRYEPDLDPSEPMDLALWEYAHLIVSMAKYIEQYGEQMVFLGSDATAATVLRLAGWHPPFSQREANWIGLALVRAPDPTVRAFLTTLLSQDIGRQLYERWKRDLQEAATSGRPGAAGHVFDG
jgi:hypothetical protein